MSKILSVTLLLLVVVVAAFSYAVADDANNLLHIDNYDKTNECPPNESFMHKCNYCKCGPEGKDAACTKMACP
ncbi:hypothetical protein TSAR_012004 [Trichomalopsis sarcophagae]|uniref:Pacifastin domain-containing protein n=1 Tax=Trichomalopsis sarcophagae TaxID=543379 RepID=A0A232F5J7_9HYME|nr:hypothetical protein TSAR_012004 [Trichomalopsis sarcophagae]